MRTRKKKWAPGQLANNPRILRDIDSSFEEILIPGMDLNIDTQANSGRIRAYFGNDNPIHLEIGCGKGRFIAEASRQSPDINFIAMERESVILAAAARHAQENGAGSLAFLLLDADQLQEVFLPGDIARLYINFCDPWPKKRRAKRRLTHEKYLTMYEQLTIPEIHFKTDNRPLFEFSIESLSARGWQLKNVSLDLHNSGMEGNIMTEYEQKFSSMGMPIYRLEASPPS